MRLRELVRAMLHRMVAGQTDSRLLPSDAAAEAGDFAANRLRLREIVAAGGPKN